MVRYLEFLEELLIQPITVYRVTILVFTFSGTNRTVRTKVVLQWTVTDVLWRSLEPKTAWYETNLVFTRFAYQIAHSEQENKKILESVKLCQATNLVLTVFTKFRATWSNCTRRVQKQVSESAKLYGKITACQLKTNLVFTQVLIESHSPSTCNNKFLSQ